MLTRFARLATGRPRAVLIGAALIFTISGAVGGGVTEHLTAGGFDDPASESFKAEEVLDEQFGTGTPNVVLVVTAHEGSVDDPDVVSAGEGIGERLASEPDVGNVVSYWSEGGAPPLRNEDGRRALVLGRIDADTDDDLVDRIDELAPQLRQDDPVVSVEVGGFAQVFHDVSETIESDLLRAELIALPITLVLLVLVFGSVVASSLPLAVGALSIVGTLLVLRGWTAVTDVSVYALNLTTALGLGLAIDYSLFIVARYREELRAGHHPTAAVVRTVQTAGRTVGFSALTVAASLCALLIFPQVFLRSFAYAGMTVALLAGLFSVLVLPAILRLLGHRVNALTVRARSVTPPERGFWHWVASAVMRRPIPIATLVIAVLLLVGSPFLGVRLTLPDDRVLPEDAPSRQVGDIIRAEFSSEDAGALAVVAPEGNGVTPAAIESYAQELALLPAVGRVDAASGTYCGEGLADQLGCQPGERVLGPEASSRYAGFTAGDGTFLSVVPAVEPLSSAGESLVDAVRAAPAPFPVMVTGPAAQLVDSSTSISGMVPWALAIIAVITFVLLFMMFGSVVIPFKAIVLNLLSLTATFGAMVWVFQDGNLSGLLDFTATGGLNTAMPILVFCIAFGLSMDYEVFLLSRIKEEHDRGADNRAAVAVGLQRTGRIVSTAAVIIAVVFLAFATSGVSFIKMMGVGMALAVLLDAFVIRGTLVPAFMRLAGEWNWWAPRPLRRFHDRWGISEHLTLDDVADLAERETGSVDSPTYSDDGNTRRDQDRAAALR
jgi:putative drug exporter of the RND superfamily